QGGGDVVLLSERLCIDLTKLVAGQLRRLIDDIGTEQRKDHADWTSLRLAGECGGKQLATAVDDALGHLGWELLALGPLRVPFERQDRGHGQYQIEANALR